jgi:cyclopropane fatty-acyl-phospholipid synthase-like methyltransferase
MRAGAILFALCLSACDVAGLKADQPQFPKADRPVAPIVSSRWSDERSRDEANESEKIMDLAGVLPGMTVADIGAGEGYYTIRLASRVGKKGRVLAQDIVPEVRDALALRVSRERLDNVSVRLGEPEDPKLPEGSFDRIMLVHMYHEVTSPYQFLWNMRPALRQGGRVIVVDADRITAEHGTPSLLLQCEFAAVGYKLVAFEQAAFAGGYLATFEASGDRPSPDKIVPCALGNPPRTKR